MMSDLADGLFLRAISQSGVAMTFGELEQSAEVAKQLKAMLKRKSIKKGI